MKTIDAGLAATLFLAGALVAAGQARELRQSPSAPPPPAFNQRVYAAAAFSACGRGLTTPSAVVASAAAPRPQDQAFAEFILQKRDALACEAIAPDLSGDGLDALQRASIYLQWTVAGAWRLGGLNWRAIDWIFGVFFGITIALAYLFCRQAMPVWASAAVGVLYLISPVHLAHLYDIRDYSKVPFFMFAMLMLAIATIRRRTPSTIIAATAAGGAALGIGFGMRTDVAVNLPILIAGVGLFVAGSLTETIRTRAAAVVACLLAFFLTASPLLANTETSNSPWHLAMLGLAQEWTEALEIAEGPYQLGHFYSDSYVATEVDAFWSRTAPAAERVSVAMPHYAEASRAYYLALARTFPADLFLRCWAAVLKVLALPYSHGWLSVVAPIAVWMFVGVVLATSVRELRLALLLCGVALAVCAYPAIQFQRRHYFHLEIVGLFTLGLAASRVLPEALRIFTSTRELPHTRGIWLRPAALALAIALFVFAPIRVLRASQQQSATALFDAYASADITALEPSRPVYTGSMSSELIVAHLAAEHCPVDRPSIAFRYTAASSEYDFSQTFDVDLPEGETATIFFPVFESGALSPDPAAQRFSGVEIAPGEQACVTRIGRVANPSAFPVLVPVVLSQDWRERPLHQSLRGWERNPYESDARPREYFASPGTKLNGRAIFARARQASSVDPASVDFAAPATKIAGDGVIAIRARGVPTGHYLLASKAGAIDRGTIVVATGRLERGGLEIGVVDSSGWRGRVLIDRPGSFQAAIEVPADGSYQIVIANHAAAGAPTRAEIARLVRVPGFWGRSIYQR